MDAAAFWCGEKEKQRGGGREREREGGGGEGGEANEKDSDTERQILRLHKVAGTEAVLPRSMHAVSRLDQNVPSFAFSLDVDFFPVTFECSPMSVRKGGLAMQRTGCCSSQEGRIETSHNGARGATRPGLQARRLLGVLCPYPRWRARSVRKGSKVGTGTEQYCPKKAEKFTDSSQEGIQTVRSSISG